MADEKKETPKSKAQEVKAEKDAAKQETKPAPQAEEPEKKETPPQVTEAKKDTKAEKAPKKKVTKGKKDEAKTEEQSPAASLSLDDDLPKPKIVKAKGSKNVIHGIVHILATFNNTLVSVSDARGNILGWSSSGKCGFRGSKKSTAYVAQVVAQDACRQAMAHGLKEVEVRMKGPGSGRESAVRAVQAIGLDVNSIRDVTPIPHNGCRLRKQRRV
ncbi:MAG: 30S ribosomal protein S11 [Verrucomicrobiota bacterium]